MKHRTARIRPDIAHLLLYTCIASTPLIPCRNERTLALVTCGIEAAGGNADSFGPALSASGDVLCFNSLATDLVRSVTPPGAQTFKYGTKDKSLAVVSLPADEKYFESMVLPPTLTADGNGICIRLSRARLTSGLDIDYVAAITRSAGASWDIIEPIQVGFLGDVDGFNRIYMSDDASRVLMCIVNGTRGREGFVIIDRQHLKAQLLADSATGAIRTAAMTHDGNRIVMLADPLGTDEAQAVVVSEAPAQHESGEQLNSRCVLDRKVRPPLQLSRNGKFAALRTESQDEGAWAICIIDLERLRTSTVRIESGVAAPCSISTFALTDDARTVVFVGRVGDKPANVYLYSMDKNELSCISAIHGDGFSRQADADCYSVAVSADAGIIAFDTDAGNLFSSDTNGRSDIYVSVRGDLK